jgi:hypothetical protein
MKRSEVAFDVLEQSTLIVMDSNSDGGTLKWPLSV